MKNIEEINKASVNKILAKKKIPEFFPGDTVKIGVRIVEGKRERIQYFEGVCIAKKNRNINSSFTVRKISFGEGVERTFALYSPIIGSIKVIRSGKVKRAKLYYLRNRKGKSARISEKIKKSIGIDISEQVSENKVIKEAEKIGALALFGEKYNEEVRVVSMEDGKQEFDEKNIFSLELCGGTHISNLGEIGLLKIISDTALGSGIRRIEAVAGEAAIKYIQSSNEILNELSSELKVSKEKLRDRVLGFIEERKNLEKKIIELNKKINTSSISQKDDNYSEISGVKVITKVLEAVSPRDLKGLVDEFKKKIVEGVVIIIGIDKQKASIVVGVTEKLKKEFNAQVLVKIGVKCLGGEGGGGREDLAQGGGPNYNNAQEALEKIIQEIKNIKS